MKLLATQSTRISAGRGVCRIQFFFEDARSFSVDRGFSGKSGERLFANDGGSTRLLVGLGARAKYDRDALRKASAEAAVESRARGSRRLVFALDDWPGADAADAAVVAAESARLAQYRYTLASKSDDKPALVSFTVVCRSAAQTREIAAGLKRVSDLSDAVDLARHISNLPGNLAAPQTVAQIARRLGGRGVRVKILGRAACRKLGMGAFLAVAQGSRQPPAFLVMEYRPRNRAAARRRPIALVGKGVTFDAGGISLKPADRMEEMKHDKSGAAAVIAVFSAARALHPRIPIVGVVPLTENLPGGNATRPGDVVRSMSGKTIEIKNTDAEGRLILADALFYAGRFRPEAIIDMATLTGACSIALGDVYAAVLSNNDALAGSLAQAGEACGERLWRLPLHDAYDRLIKSAVADVSNIPEGRLAGTVIGGMFLKKFLADEKTPWAHIDIAATAWDVKGRDGKPAGSTGIGVRLFYEFLKIRGDIT